MTFYEDLSPCDYFNRKDRSYSQILQAVGWLVHNREFAKGECYELFLEKLVTLLKLPWQPYVFLGYHSCPICGTEQESCQMGRPIKLGRDNLFVPGTGSVYVFPNLGLHYIEKHNYAPPIVFQDAVMNCPMMSSPEYFFQLKQCGLKIDEISRPRASKESEI